MHKDDLRQICPRHHKSVRKQVPPNPYTLPPEEHCSYLRTESSGDLKSLQREIEQMFCNHSLRFKNGKGHHVGTLNLYRHHGETQFDLNKSANRKSIPAK